MPGVGTTHHIALNGHYYIVKPGSYQKRVAPQFGARFTTGDPDFNNLSVWQHWSQRCWVGGMDAPEWADDAMFDESVGVNSTEHEILTLSRSLRRGTGANWALGGQSERRKFFLYNDVLFCLTTGSVANQSVVWLYNGSTDGWSTTAALPTGFEALSVGVFAGRVYLGGEISGVPKVYWSATANLASWTLLANPGGVIGSVLALRAFQERLYVAYADQIWRLKADNTWDGNTVFYTAQTPHVVAMEVHLGFLYMLTVNGHVLRTDGNSTFDIWQWDGGTVGVALRSFDGRLFIATYEYGDDTGNIGDEGFGVLYQMTGSAVTQLKRWGKIGEATMIGSLIVHDRKMFYGASNFLGFGRGFGIAVYDPVEDAHSMFAANGDTATYAPGAAPYLAYMVDDVAYYANRLFVSVRGHGAFYAGTSYRDRERGIADYMTTTGFASGGQLQSSTYDAGTPGLRKLWRKVSLDYELPNVATSIVAEYSINNGTSWVALTTLTTGSPSGRVRADIHLNNVIAVSFKLRLSLKTTDGAYTPAVYGWVVSYIPVTEPNWLWTFTIVLADKMVLLDGSESVVDTEAELAFLRDTYRTKQLVPFVDADGSLWASGGEPGVLIYDISFILRDLNQPLEGEVLVTLLEAVETY